MIRNRVHIILLFPFFLFSLATLGQVKVKATVDRSTILVGEPIRLRLEATTSAQNHLSWFRIDTIPHFEFVQKGPLDSTQEGNTKTYSQEFVITSYDSGYWAIPSFRMQAAKTKLKTDTLAINVTFSPADPSKDYHDIKEIIPVKKPSPDYWYWIAGVGAILAAAAGIYFYLKKEKPVKPVPVAGSRLTPYEEAMKALDELSGQRPVQDTEIKTYFTRLNDILRVYLKRRFDFSTLEKTNEELIFQLRKTKMPADDFTQLAQALRMNDFVKFAKYVPSEGERKELFDAIRKSIKSLEQLNTSA